MTTIAEEIPPGDWMRSVAELLPVSRFEPRPFTLGEAVAELKLWAEMARAESWANRGNRDSLISDVASGLRVLGPRLKARVEDLAPALDPELDRKTVVAACAEFLARWSTPDAITDSFRDLCEAAASCAGMWELRPRAEVLASQTGDTARGWGVLDEVSSALHGEPHDFEFERWLGEGATAVDLTPSIRLEAAERLLTTKLASRHVVVWLLYRRAFGPFAFSAGPFSLFRTDWAIPNAMREDGQDFIHRDELRQLIANHSWIAKDDFLGSNPEGDRHVLVRVDLGEGHPTGAAEEALRRVEALISIAVGSGGVSWVYTGISITLVDGRTRGSSFGRAGGGREPEFQDTYGMRATADVVEYWAKELAPALEAGAMPDFLIEALSAFREASMIDHRDVSFYNARPTSPRIATALEDHAIELVASLAVTTPENLVSQLEAQEVEHQAEQMILKALLEPIDQSHHESKEIAETAEAIESSIVEYSEGTRLVSLSKAWDAKEKIRALPMSLSMRTTFEDGLRAISSVDAERAVLDRARLVIETVRARHRRVRNAVTHGNPVTSAALDSVRNFSRSMSRSALDLALNSFASSRPIETLLAENARYREEATEKMASGMSRVERERTAVAQAAKDEGA